MDAIAELKKMTPEERSKLKWNDPRLIAATDRMEMLHDVPKGSLRALLFSENSYFDKKTKEIKSSNNDSHAVSQAKARGVMQFTPGTMKLQNGMFDHNPLDPIESINAAGKYMKYVLTNQYKGNVPAAIADYNGGPKQAKAVLEGKRPPSPETAEYLDKAKEFWKTLVAEAPATEAPPVAPVQPPEQSFLDKVKRVAPPVVGGGGELVSEVFK